MPDVISEPATPRPKVVFVAATVQVVFEVLNLPTVSVLTIAWASWCDNNYCSHRGLMSVAYNQSPNPYSARHVVFDWIAFAMGLILASGLLHSARPQGCIRCCCNGGCGPSRYPAAPNGWLKVAALLSVQVTVRLLGLLVNVLADCLNRSYWYSRSGLWDGTVECDPIWPYTIVRGVMLFPPLVTLGCTLCAFRAEHRAARRPMPGSADALPTEVAPAEHHTSHSALEIDEEADKAKAALPAPAHRRRRSICTPLGAFWLLVAVELVATALTAALQIELVLRPECECDDAVGAPVWLPPGCRMPSWAGEQEPALVATADGTSFDLFDSCEAVVRAIERGRCPAPPGSHFYPTYSRPYGRGGGIGRDLSSGEPLDVISSQMEIMASADQAASTGPSGQRKRAPVAAAAADEAGGPAYSATNVQEQGVDEADVVKTDGRHVYVLHTVRPTATGAATAVLTIATSFPAAEAAVVATVDVEAAYGLTPYDMYVDGDRLLVLGYHYAEAGMEGERPLLTTRALLLDIRARAAPAVLRAVEVEGAYISSRKVGSFVYVVSESHGKPGPDGVMPSFRASAQPAQLADEQLTPLGGCTGVGRVRLARGTNLLSVWSLSMADAAAGLTSTTVLGRGANVYASPHALYVASPTYWSQLGQQTAVLRFALSDGVASFHGVAVAPGYILNQFAMDEVSSGASAGAEGGGAEGGGAATTFRIATTITQSWGCWEGCASSGPEGNHLFTYAVPAAPPPELTPYETLGSLTGLAPGESIYSVRFLAERAYMVTFRQVDPLYVIDLASASSPTVLGYLKMPGYSDYLHPVNRTHVLGLGQGGTEAGRITGVKLALFDASDVAAPAIAFAVEVGGPGTRSAANQDHKAFLYDAERRLLTLPISVTADHDAVCSAPSAGHWDPWQHALWQGALTWNVTEESFELLGAVSHYDPAAERYLPYDQDVPGGWGDGYGDYRERSDVCGYSEHANDCAQHGAFRIERALYVADSLLTVSPAALRFDNVSALRRGTLPPTADGGSVQAELALESMANSWACPGGSEDGCPCRCLAPCERKAPVLSLLVDGMQ